MYHYVYRITDKITNKHYYGKRSCTVLPIEDLGHTYFSSSRDKKFIQEQKDNPQRFKYKIVRICKSVKEALLLEVKLHAMFNVGINPCFINKAKQTTDLFSTCGKVIAKNILTGEIEHVDREKFLESTHLVGIRKNFTMTETHKLAISKANKGRSLTEGHKKNISKASKGRSISEAARTAFEEQRKKPWSQEAKDKLSKALKGRKFSDEHKEKLALAQKGKKKPCTKTKEQLLAFSEKISKKADIYNYLTGEIIAIDVIIARWAKENGYDAPQLGKTTRRDLSAPKSRTNVYHHKGIYAVYKENNET
jgi:hypothetical protein